VSFDAMYDDMVERISDRVVEKLAGAEQQDKPEAWCLLTLKQAAERLTRSPSWLRERARRGDVPTVRLDGGALAFRLEDLQGFAERHLVDGTKHGPDRKWWAAA
jgi:hypothetical protein